MRHLILAFAAVLLTACSSGSDDAAFERVTLPGFSVELPRGTVKHTSNAPSAGKHELELPEPSFLDSLSQKVVGTPKVSVEWMAQSFTREEWDRDMVPIFTQAVARGVPGARVLHQEAVGDDRWLHIVGLPDSPVAFGVVRCDDGFSVMLVHGRYRDVEKEAVELRRIMKSVQCKVTEANRARVLAAVRLPEKFGRTKASEAQIYRSLDGETMTLNFSAGDIQKDQRAYRAVVASLLSNSMGIQLDDSQLAALDTAVQRPSGKSSLLRVDLPNSAQHVRLYVGSVYCADRNLTLLSFWGTFKGDDALARERLSQVGCPHEQSTEYGSFEDMVDEACKAGDAMACEIRKNPDL
jgi:hypothetical protein